jgi:hypothetical protein
MEGNWAEGRKLNGEIQKRNKKDKEDYLKENARCWKSTIKKAEQETYINR